MRALPIHVRTLASAGPNANGRKVPAVDPMVGTRSTWSYYLAPWSSSQALLDWTAKQLQQGVSRIQRRPLFGTQCRPVGGPAGFEPHRHRTAPCTYTCLRLLGNVRVRATSEGASSISRGDVLAHCRGFGTCGWTDVGGTSTRTKIVPSLWDPLPWRHGPRYTCQGHGLSGQSVVPPRLSGKSSCFGPSRLGYPSLDLHSPSRRRGRPAGWTQSPGTNLPTT